MIKSDKNQVTVQHRASILAFFMAKDDNMILLMSGLIHSIQKRPDLWRHNPSLNDLFGLASFQRDEWQAKTKQEALQHVYKNDSGISIVTNLMNILDI